MFKLESGMVVEVQKERGLTYGVVVDVKGKLFFQYFDGGFDYAKMDLAATKILKVYEFDDSQNEGFMVNLIWQRDRLMNQDISNYGKVVWKLTKLYTLEEAAKISENGKKIKHKDNDLWSISPDMALRNACIKTKLDMFELLKRKEFMVEE